MIQSRKNILAEFVKISFEIKNDEFNYSAIMRKLRKENPELVKEFMSSFKEAFELAYSEAMEDADKISLIQALKTIGLK